MKGIFSSCPSVRPSVICTAPVFGSAGASVDATLGGYIPILPWPVCRPAGQPASRPAGQPACWTKCIFISRLDQAHKVSRPSGPSLFSPAVRPSVRPPPDYLGIRVLGGSL
eukprot:EG_transcript_18989